MTCSACGCNCGGVGANNGDLGREAAPLLDLDKGRNAEAPSEEEKDVVKVMAERAANRIAKFTARGLLILLGVYLFDIMKRYAVKYIGEDTWFSTFAVIVVAVPVAEIFCILGQSMTTHRKNDFILADLQRIKLRWTQKLSLC